MVCDSRGEHPNCPSLLIAIARCQREEHGDDCPSSPQRAAQLGRRGAGQLCVGNAAPSVNFLRGRKRGTNTCTILSMCLSAPSNTQIKRRPSNLLPSTHSVLSTILGGLSSSHACVPLLVLAHRSRGPISCHVLDLAIGPLFVMPLAAAVSRLFGTVLPHGLVAASLVRCVRLSASECSDTV